MKLEDQVLSIEQVQELQELGFDVRKHASLYFVEEKYFVKENFIVLPEQIDITRVPEDVKITPTMTIGDIIDILPEVLDRPRIIHRNYYLFITKLAVSYSNRDRYDHEFIRYIETKNPNFHPFENKKSFIICLFEALKWCIKEKHIKL